MLLGPLPTGCVSGDIPAQDRISIPLGRGVTHEQAIAKIKEVLGLRDSDFENPPAAAQLEIWTPEKIGDIYNGRYRVSRPFPATEKRLDQYRTRLAYTDSTRKPASSLDMGPPRGEMVLVTTIVDVDTSLGESALIAVSTQGSDHGYNEWRRRGVMDSLTAMSQRSQPSAPAKP
jgi:hypothetical protein